MKVIFLDFDGVLNSTASFIANKKDREAGLIDVFANPCKSAVALVDRLILSDPAIRVVISSTWRVKFKERVSALREILVHDFGMSEDAAAMVIGTTPVSFNRPRGHEIKWWLEEAAENNPSNPVTHYVILDDNSDMTEDQKNGHFIQTNPDNGFKWQDYVNARHILEVPNDKFVVF